MKHVSFTGSQLVLFERLQAFGFDKFEAEFLTKFREVSSRHMLKDFRRPRRSRCMEPGCVTLLDNPCRQFCDEHRGKRLLGMDVDDPSRPFHSVN